MCESIVCKVCECVICVCSVRVYVCSIRGCCVQSLRGPKVCLWCGNGEQTRLAVCQDFK